MKIKSPAKWLDLKEYTEINHIQFLLQCIQEADIEDGEESMDEYYERSETDKAEAELFKLYKVHERSNSDSLAYQIDFLRASNNAIEYWLELTKKDSAKHSSTKGMGSIVFNAAMESARWLGINCKTWYFTINRGRLQDIHRAIEKIALVDGRLKGREPEFLNELANIWNLQTKKYEAVEYMSPAERKSDTVKKKKTIRKKKEKERTKKKSKKKLEGPSIGSVSDNNFNFKKGDPIILCLGTLDNPCRKMRPASIRFGCPDRCGGNSFTEKTYVDDKWAKENGYR
jgi:hypothetical protein